MRAAARRTASRSRTASCPWSPACPARTSGAPRPPRSTPTAIKSGIEYDLATDIAKACGLKMEFRNENFDAIVAGQIAEDSYDIALSQVTITDDRAKVVDFSVPYFKSDQGLLVSKGTTVVDLGRREEDEDRRPGLDDGRVLLPRGAGVEARQRPAELPRPDLGVRGAVRPARSTASSSTPRSTSARPRSRTVSSRSSPSSRPARSTAPSTPRARPRRRSSTRSSRA